MQRVISHTEQRLCNGKNQEKNGTRFFATVPLLGSMVPFFFNGTVAGCNGTVARRNGTIAGATGDK